MGRAWQVLMSCIAATQSAAFISPASLHTASVTTNRCTASNSQNPTAKGVVLGSRDVRCHVSERQIPQYVEAMKLYEYNGDVEGLGSVASFTEDDFDSYIGDPAKLVGFRDKKPYKLVHKSRRAVFSREECQAIIDECEEYARAQGWTSRRHFAYPTTDLPLAVLPRTTEWFRRALATKLYPMLACNFGSCLPDPTRLRAVDAFVVKYDADGGQTQLKPHRDGSVVSFNIALNPSHEFEGGGTYFAGLDDAIRLEEGQVVSHASNVLHGGHPITAGKRYILVAFVILEGYQNFATRFAHLVWNM